jgi:hypothetical protein
MQFLVFNPPLDRFGYLVTINPDKISFSARCPGGLLGNSRSREGYSLPAQPFVLAAYLNVEAQLKYFNSLTVI